MSLETLANELLFQAFEYLSAVDLFHAFQGLNLRFDDLIVEHFRDSKHIDLRLIPKEDLSLMRRRYLQFFINEIESLRISNENTTPNEIDQFLSRINPLYRFQNLRSISLFGLDSLDKINRILHDLRNVLTLTTLNFKHCRIEYDPKNILVMMNTIWTLSNLTDCCLDMTSDESCYLITPSVISCSLKHLSISGFQCDLESISHLYDHTPYVEHLSFDLSDTPDHYHELCLLHSITTLHIKCNVSSRIIQPILRKTPYLMSLTVETAVSIDGRWWKDIVNKYLPKLTVFNLKMDVQLTENDDVEQEVDRIVETFRDPFWIDQRQWFVRCFGYSEHDRWIIHFHTIPYAFDCFSLFVDEQVLFKSTRPQDKHDFKCNYVQKLQYNCVSSKDVNLPYFQFPNVQKLTLTLPYSDHLKRCIPRFTSLVSLTLKLTHWSHDEDDLDQIQAVLDQAPRLFYLKFHSWMSAASKFDNKSNKGSTKTSWRMPPYANQSTSVRYLDLRGVDQHDQSQCYTDQQCVSFIRSPLGAQCQHLLINLEKRSNIVDLVMKMNHLRTLNVRCRQRNNNDDDAIKWLQARLPSTCSFARDSTSSWDIRIWIR